MSPRRHQFATEQEYAEKRGLQEKRGEALIREERRKNVAGCVRITTPVRAELKRHDNAGDDTHPERDREDLDPEHRDTKIDLAPGEEVEPFQNRNERRETDGEGWQKNVPGNDPGELQS